MVTDLVTDRMPTFDGPKMFSMGDLFSNMNQNWGTLTPVISILFGVIFGAFVAVKVMAKIRGDDD